MHVTIGFSVVVTGLKVSLILLLQHVQRTFLSESPLTSENGFMIPAGISSIMFLVGTLRYKLFPNENSFCPVKVSQKCLIYN